MLTTSRMTQPSLIVYSVLLGGETENRRRHGRAGSAHPGESSAEGETGPAGSTIRKRAEVRLGVAGEAGRVTLYRALVD